MTAKKKSTSTAKPTAKKKAPKAPNSIHEFGAFLKKLNLLGNACEVGVAEGRSSQEFLGFGFKHITLVDQWEHIPGQHGDGGMPPHWHASNLAEVVKIERKNPGKVRILQGDSVAMAAEVKDGSLDFVYLDANHAYEAVLADLKAWLPKIKKGGIMAGHDYNHLYGVEKAVNEFAGVHVNVLPEHAIENQGFWFYADSVRHHKAAK